MEEMVYSVHEVAKMLRCSPNFVYKLIDNGFLPAIKFGSIKILKSTLLKFLMENESLCVRRKTAVSNPEDRWSMTYQTERGVSKWHYLIL